MPKFLRRASRIVAIASALTIVATLSDNDVSQAQEADTSSTQSEPGESAGTVDVPAGIFAAEPLPPVLTSEEADFLTRLRATYSLPPLAIAKGPFDFELWQNYQTYGLPLTDGEVPEWTKNLDKRRQVDELVAKLGPAVVGFSVTSEFPFRGSLIVDRDYAHPVTSVEGLTVQASKRSAAEIEALEEALVSSFTKQKKSVSLFIKEDNLNVVVASSDDVQIVENLISADMAAVVDISVDPSVNSEPVPLHCYSRNGCTPVQGGQDLNGGCTSGFAAIRDVGFGSDRGVTTAAHCPSTGWVLYALRNDSSSDPRIVASFNMLTPLVVENQTTDVSLINTFDPSNGSEEYTQNLLYESSNSYARPVLGFASPGNSERVCVSGINFNGLRCGSVVVASFTAVVNGVQYTNRIEINWDDQTPGLDHGDSGGPIVRESNRSIAIATISRGHSGHVRADTTFDWTLDSKVSNWASSAGGLVLYVDPTFPSHKQFLISGYSTMAFTAPDSAGLAYWRTQLQMNCIGGSRAFIVSAGTAIPNVGITRRLRRLYRGAVGREADSGGLAFGQPSITRAYPGQVS